MREVAMLTRITIAVAGALTMLLLAPLEAKASAQGVGQSSHFEGQHLAHHQFRHHRHHHRASPWYGYYDVPSYASDLDMTYSTPETATPETAVVAPTPPAGCQHSEQTVKVPSENGGEREVTILRC
jgi:hypothetical protein